MGLSWNSSEGAHQVVLRSFSEFKSNEFRQVALAPGVWAVIGKQQTSDTQSVIQSVVFARNKFASVTDAKSWLSDKRGDHDREYAAGSGEDLDPKQLLGSSSVNKRLVSVQRAAEGSGESTGVSAPTSDQLAKINQFTRTAKTADELAVLPILACNDIVDRDLDQFTKETVRGFMKLEGPLSPIGKSFMVGHDYTNLPIGRIFDGKTANEGGVEWLKLWTYVPNTEQYKSYLENVDFGVYWAVSVGVMLGASSCSVGEPHDWSWHPWLCSAKHMKGSSYDPKSAEVDDWGYPVEAESGGELCFRKLEQPQDFYELSQVYLGAQYHAALGKAAGNALGSAHLGSQAIKVFSIKSAELEQLEVPLPLEVPAGSPVAKAVEHGWTVTREDGTFRWKDASNLIWTFEPGSEDLLCLGKSQDDVPLEEPSGETEQEVDNPAESEDAEVDKAAVLAAARQAKLPDAMIQQLDAASGNGLEVVMAAAGGRITQLEGELAKANERSALGDAYIQSLKSDAVHWYTMAQRDPALPEKGVNTETFMRMLDLCGDNVELIQEHKKAYQELARAKFPEAVRRSTFPADVNERTELHAEPEEPVRAGSEKAVHRIHR